MNTPNAKRRVGATRRKPLNDGLVVRVLTDAKEIQWFDEKLTMLDGRRDLSSAAFGA